jgi:hypothetical protein
MARRAQEAFKAGRRATPSRCLRIDQYGGEHGGMLDRLVLKFATRRAAVARQ